MKTSNPSSKPEPESAERSRSRRGGSRAWLLVGVGSVAVIGTALGVLGCGSRHAEQAPARDPARVRVIRIEPATAPESRILAGRVRAAEEVTLSATVRARLTLLPFSEGASFRAGQMLARFESPEARLELSAARSTRLAAEVRLAEARRQEARVDSLVRAQVVAQRDLDVAATEARMAEAALEEARARAAVLEAGLQIQAPFDGVVVRHRVDPGAHLEAGSAVLVIRSRAGHEIEVALPESEVEGIQGQQPSYRLGGGDWRPARLLRLEGMTDYASRTRMAYLTASDLRGVEPGAYAEVRFQIDGTRAPASPQRARASDRPPAATSSPIMIPAASVVRRGGLTGVLVARDGHARLRWLRLGRVEGDTVEVLAGLWPDEEILSDPHGIEDGRAIEVTR
jgi:RND family efflux transporter MFP subunit